jgi:glyoxylase-like metal-dependent hydrolase (beta-lactamase superfamily II)
MSDPAVTHPPVAAPGFHRFRLGALSLIALHDGVMLRDRPAQFVRNVDEAVVARAFADIGSPPGKLTLTFSPLAIEAADGLTLIDTGMGEHGAPGTGRLAANLAAAGYSAADVTRVLISHFHGDHISGLITKAGLPVYPNAEILVPQPEWDFWMNDARAAAAPDGLKPSFDLARRVFGAMAGKVARFAWDVEVMPGVRSVQADGHTPGQSAFEISSSGETLLFAADMTNNPLVFARYPDWHAVFDMDPLRSVEIRRQLLARAAAAGSLLHFYHAPFPAVGCVFESGDGYQFVPALYG